MTNERFSRTPPAKATELFEKLLATSDKAVKARERLAKQHTADSQASALPSATPARMRWSRASGTTAAST